MRKSPQFQKNSRPQPQQNQNAAARSLGIPAIYLCVVRMSAPSQHTGCVPQVPNLLDLWVIRWRNAVEVGSDLRAKVLNKERRARWKPKSKCLDSIRGTLGDIDPLNNVPV